MTTVLEITSVLRSVCGIAGGVFCVYFLVRVGATVHDIYGRWQRNDW